MGIIPFSDKERQERFWKDKPASAHANYQLYKFLITLTSEELQVLFKKRKTDCKYASKEQIKQLRTEMKLINDVYNDKNVSTINIIEGVSNTDGNGGGD